MSQPSKQYRAFQGYSYTNDGRLFQTTNTSPTVPKKEFDDIPLSPCSAETDSVPTIIPADRLDSRSNTSVQETQPFLTISADKPVIPGTPSCKTPDVTVARKKFMILIMVPSSTKSSCTTPANQLSPNPSTNLANPQETPPNKHPSIPEQPKLIQPHHEKSPSLHQQPPPPTKVLTPNQRNLVQLQYERSPSPEFGWLEDDEKPDARFEPMFPDTRTFEEKWGKMDSEDESGSESSVFGEDDGGVVEH